MSFVIDGNDMCVLRSSQLSKALNYENRSSRSPQVLDEQIKLVA